MKENVTEKFPKKTVVKCPICGDPCFSDGNVPRPCPDCIKKAEEKEKRNEDKHWFNEEYLKRWSNVNTFHV